MSIKEKQEEIRKQLAKERLERIPSFSASPLEVRVRDKIRSMGIGCFGTGGTGKTTIIQHICRELCKDPRVQVKIYDPVQNWKHDFESTYYQDIDPSYINRMDEIYFGAKNIIFNAKFIEPKESRKMLSAIVAMDYELNWRYKEAGVLTNYTVYVVEESQLVLGSLGSTSIWNTFISGGRNMNLSFIFLGRSMTDLTARARKNVKEYLWGQMVNELDLKRVKDQSKKRNSDLFIDEILPELGLGEFIYWDGKNAIKLKSPGKFEQMDKPVRWTP